MKKLAIFSNDLSVGGIQKSLSNLLRNIDYTKFEVDVYLMQKNNFYQDILPNEVNVHYLKKYSVLHKFIPYQINKYFYKYEGLNKEYDIAIDFDGYQQLTALNAIKCNAKKRVMWIHNNMIEKMKYSKKFKILTFFSKNKNKYFDEYVGVSKGVIKPFKQLNKLKNIKYTIIPNIIDTNEIFEKSKEKCELKIDKTKYNFCSLGRVSVQKGFDILLEYLKDLKECRKDFHFYLIGDGEELNHLKQLVNEYKIDKYVTFLGLQKNPFKYMKLMDGFILTSRYEGQGMVLWEAKALGLEIFMTKNLEKYNENLKGYSNLLLALKKAKKQRKIKDNLNKYNNNIIESLENLFNN